MPLICCTLLPLVLAANLAAEQTPGPEKKRIVFLGDSLSAGSGVKPQQAFPALVADKIRERGLPFEVVNAGVGGDTTAGGLRRLDWLLQRKVDVLVLELGGNDGLRGLPVSNIKENLKAMIDKARAKYPDVKIVLAGMQMPPNVGAKYREEFQQVFHDVAKENSATMIPFLLEGVGGLRELNQSDLIHPNPEGHKIIADVVWKTLEPLLLERQSAAGAFMRDYSPFRRAEEIVSLSAGSKREASRRLLDRPRRCCGYGRFAAGEPGRTAVALDA